MRLKRCRRVVLAVSLAVAFLLALASAAYAVSAPYHFAATEDGLGNVRMNWSAISGATSLAVYRGTAYPAPQPTEAEPIWTGSADATSCIDTPPFEGLWVYRLVAFDSDGSYASIHDAARLGDNVIGHAYDTSGTPLAGIEVALFPRALQTDPSRPPIAVLTTDGQGAFSIKLPVDQYYVRYRDPSGTYMEEWYGGTHQMHPQNCVSLNGDYSLGVSDVYMDKVTFVSGTARSNFTRQPLAGVQVTVSQTRYDGYPPGQPYDKLLTEVTTGSDGTYQVLLDAGKEYRLRFSGAEHQSTSTASFNLAWGQRITGMDASMTPQYDHVAPVTLPTLDERWRPAPARMWFQATDDRDGVNRTMLSLDGAAEATYTGPLTFETTGEHTIRFRSIDNRGNAEETKTVTVRVDSGLPTVTAAVGQPEPGAPALVTLDAFDAESGVAATFVRYGGVTRIYEGPFTISVPTDGLLEWWAMDVAGNTGAVGSQPLAVGVVAPPAEPSGDPGDVDRWAWRNDGASGGLADADMDLPEVEPLVAQAETVTVAFVGSGLYLEDGDLRDRLWQNDGEIPDNDLDDDANGFVDDVHGARFGGAGSVTDHSNLWSYADGWRMTHYASIVAGEADNGYGVSGIAQNVEIMAVPVLSEVGGYFYRRWVVDATVDAAIRYAVDNGADIIHMEVWGGTQAGVRYAAERDVLVVTGNQGQGDWLPVAADSSSTIVVGQSDRADRVSEWELNGPSVDLVAPGAAPGTASPRYAGLYVDKPPYRVAYLSVSAERAVSRQSDGAILIGEALRMVAPETSTPVLVVDGTSYSSSLYEASGARMPALREAALAYGYRNVSVYPGRMPSAADMAGKAVLYCTGVDYPHLGSVDLDRPIREELARFLEGGGSLVFMSGELGKYRAIGWVNDYEGFYGRYLHAIYVGDSGSLEFAGVENTLLAGKSFTQRETVFDEPEYIWPADSYAKPILRWPDVVSYGGSGVAAAHVTGVAALLRGVRPELAAGQVRQRIMDTTDKLDHLKGLNVSGGRLNAYRALSPTGTIDPEAHETHVTLSASTSTPAYGVKSTLAGQVLQAGVPLKNVAVGLQETTGARAGQVVATGSTGETGSFTFVVGPASLMSYRVVVRPFGDVTPTPSTVVSLKPRAWVSTPAAPSGARRGILFTAYGYLKPRHVSGRASVTLKCYRYERGRWVHRKTFSAVNSNYSSYTKYSKKIALPYTGRWRIRAYHSDADHAPTYSSGYRYVTVR